MLKSSNTGMVRTLLLKFHEQIDLTPLELERIEQYLFSDTDILLVFVQPEIEQTITYLKEMVTDNKFTTVEELHAYYNELTLDTQIMLMLNTVDERTPSIYNDKKNCLCFNNIDIAFTNVHADLGSYNHGKLAEQFTMSCVNYLEKISIGTIKKPGLFERCGKVSKKAYPQQFTFKPLKLISKAYLEQFSHFDACEKVFVISVANSPGKRIEARKTDELLSAPGHSYSANTNCLSILFDNVLVESLDPYYSTLMTRIGKEKSICDDEVKLKLTEWLFYLKIRNSGVQARAGNECERLLFMLGDMHEHRGGKHFTNVLAGALNQYAVNVYKNKLADKEWCILKCPFGHSWLTSDNPGFSINQPSPNRHYDSPEPDPTLTNIDKDSVLYFPLSKKYCLRIQPSSNMYTKLKETPINFETPSMSELDKINGLTFATHKNMIISGNKKTLEQFDLR